MAYAGQIIQNPVSGERIEFLRTAADTNGEPLEFELTLTPDGRVPGAHVHPQQEEAFEVLEGTMKFRLGLRTIVAQAGETVVVPAGRVHKFINGGEGVARARVQVTPRWTWRICSSRPPSSPTRATSCARACPSRCTSRCS
jgi:quercetin dioxygenase-like cupin family protein